MSKVTGARPIKYTTTTSSETTNAERVSKETSTIRPVTTIPTQVTLTISTSTQTTTAATTINTKQTKTASRETATQAVAEFTPLKLPTLSTKFSQILPFSKPTALLATMTTPFIIASLPTTATTLSTRLTAIPTTATTIPTTVTTSPTTTITMSTTVTTIPTTVTTVPTTVTTIPTTVTTIPTTVTKVPTTVTTVPITVTAIPTTVTEVPTTASTLPTYVTKLNLLTSVSSKQAASPTAQTTGILSTKSTRTTNQHSSPASLLNALLTTLSTPSQVTSIISPTTRLQPSETMIKPPVVFPPFYPPEFTKQAITTKSALSSTQQVAMTTTATTDTNDNVTIPWFKKFDSDWLIQQVNVSIKQRRGRVDYTKDWDLTNYTRMVEQLEKQHRTREKPWYQQDFKSILNKVNYTALAIKVENGTRDYNYTLEEKGRQIAKELFGDSHDPVPSADHDVNSDEGVVQPIYKEDSNAVDMNKTAESIARALQRVRNEYYNQS
ncbi:hypothetical protein EB796_000205 [Bugula neritina]|uniref:Uncharacterized protein n=1 Tax=Bugula neritina TaxID=10212 RepID=A0A7J7KTE9_BUGNE|nr:hypothetical protein EB796_000205 [Bugula neritina]